jgi:hypothetical protein
MNSKDVLDTVKGLISDGSDIVHLPIAYNPFISIILHSFPGLKVITGGKIPEPMSEKKWRSQMKKSEVVE